MSKIKVLMGPASSEVCLLGLQTAVFLPVSSRGLSSVCLCPDLLFLWGHQSDWISTPPYDLILNKLKIFSPSAVTF